MMAGIGVLGAYMAVPAGGTRACLVRVALAVLVFACAAWAATQASDDSGPFVYLRDTCDGDHIATGMLCPDGGIHREGWWPVDFLRMINVVDSDLKLAGPPNDAPDLFVIYGENYVPDAFVLSGKNSVIDSLPANIDILGIDYDGDDVTVSIDLDVDSGGAFVASGASPLPADLVSIGPGDASKLASGLPDIHKAAGYFPEERARMSLLFVGAQDLPGLTDAVRVTIGPGLEPGRYVFWAVITDGREHDHLQFGAETVGGQTYKRLPVWVDYDPEGHGPFSFRYYSDSWHASVVAAAIAAALLVLPRLPVRHGGPLLPALAGGRYTRYCIIMGAALFAGLLFSTAFVWISVLPAMTAAIAAALLAVPLLPTGWMRISPRGMDRRRRMQYCTIIGAAWLAVSVFFSATSGWDSAIDNLMMLPASVVMMGSPVAYYVVSRPPCARGGPARAAASVALMALGLWAAFYMLYGIPISISVLPFMALLPVSGGCAGAALFWAGFRRACGGAAK